jgi:hypothetical protein
MFQQIAEIAKSAGLTGVSMTLRPTGDQLYVVVSFQLSALDDSKAFASSQDEAQNYTNLRSALSVPVVVTALPDELLAKLTATLQGLKTPVIDAAKALSEVDFSTMLQKATAAAPKAPAKSSAKANSASVVESEQGVDDAEPDDSADSASGNAEIPQPTVGNFDLIDSL